MINNKHRHRYMSAALREMFRENGYNINCGVFDGGSRAQITIGKLEPMVVAKRRIANDEEKRVEDLYSLLMEIYSVDIESTRLRLSVIPGRFKTSQTREWRGVHEEVPADTELPLRIVEYSLKSNKPGETISTFVCPYLHVDIPVGTKAIVRKKKDGTRWLAFLDERAYPKTIAFFRKTGCNLIWSFPNLTELSKVIISEKKYQGEQLH